MGSDDFEVWPDNWRPFEIFVSMGTQWRTGMGGPTGLDYGVLESVMHLHGVPEGERQDIFSCIRTMESAALKQMQKKD